MPGKYSHSVVLADFSSRGVISLPDDQYIKYHNASPPLQKPSASQLRARGTRSAQASYTPPSTSREGWDALMSDQPHLSLTKASTKTGMRVNAPIDASQREQQPKRYSQIYEQLPRSTPIINITHETEPTVDSERHQQPLPPPVSRLETNQALTKKSSGPKRASTYLSLKEALSESVDPESKPHFSLREHAVTVRQRHQPLVPGEGANTGPKTPAASPIRLPEALPDFSAAVSRPLSYQRSKETVNRNNAAGTTREEGRLTPETWRCPTTPEHETRKLRQEKILQSQMRRELLDVRPGVVGRSASNRSRISRNTQVWDPQKSVLEEPDFDGFSDRDETPADYSDVSKRAIVHSKNSSHDSTLIIQRPDTQDGSSSQGQASNAVPATTPRATYTRTAERNTPSRTTISSTMASSRGRRSNSSVSSVDTLSGYRPSNRPIISPRKDVRASTDKSWRLPEIREDHGFSPSIFEDREGDNDLPNLESLDADRVIGQISSGKDVTFNDAASELGAALPPPITRFRDEEDEFNANMAKLFGGGIESDAAKKGSHTIGRSADKVKKGFFSKFRSKSQPPRK